MSNNTIYNSRNIDQATALPISKIEWPDNGRWQQDIQVSSKVTSQDGVSQVEGGEHSGEREMSVRINTRFGLCVLYCYSIPYNPHN